MSTRNCIPPGETKEIPLASYLEDLLPSIFSFYQGEEVDIRIEVPEIRLPTRTVVPLGIIINELAINAIKHGFDGSEAPQFFVSFSDVGDDTHLLTVSNNGKPFPRNIGLDTTSTLGLRLVSALVEQIQGSVEIEQNSTTDIKITLPAR